MADDVIIIGLDERERWEAECAVGGLPSQSWSYAWGLKASGFEPQLAVVTSGSSRMLLPFFERSFMETTDIATLPGLSGASMAPASGAPLALWSEFAGSQGWVAGYIQLASGTALDSVPARSRLVSRNSMFVFDLHDWDIYRSVSRKFRKQHLYEGRRRGAVIVDDRARLTHRLKSLYPEFCRSMGVRQTFSSECVDRWIGDASAVALGAQLGENIEAIHLGQMNGAHAEWHLAAMSDQGRSLGAWIVWNAMQRLRTLGVRTLNIGGGVRADDGLQDYKSRFGAKEFPLMSVRQIYDPGRYAELMARTGTDTDDDWFPAYRRAHGAE